MPRPHTGLQVQDNASILLVGGVQIHFFLAASNCIDCLNFKCLLFANDETSVQTAAELALTELGQIPKNGKVDLLDKLHRPWQGHMEI